jgi:hypothetical protein
VVSRSEKHSLLTLILYTAPHLLVKLAARAIYILALNRDINLVSNLEVYGTAMFICLPPLTLLSLLDSIISDFLSAIHLFSKLNCLIL